MITQYNPHALLPALLIFIFAFTSVEAQEDPLFTHIRNSEHHEITTALKNGSNVNQINKTKNTPLMIAAKIGDLSIVKTLLSYNADPNLINKSGSTALMIAAKYGSVQVVEQLLAHGANPLIENKQNMRASGFALNYKHKKLYRILRKAEKHAHKAAKHL